MFAAGAGMIITANPRAVAVVVASTSIAAAVATSAVVASATILIAVGATVLGPGAIGLAGEGCWRAATVRFDMF